jgi:hypothetical protein
MSKPPRLPFDILNIIAQISIPNYRALLALPRFGRRSLQPSFQFLLQSHFTTYTLIKECTEDSEEYFIHKWTLDYPYNEILHHPILPDGSTPPAFIRYYPNGQKDCEMWYYNGQSHRVGGPASLDYDYDGKLDFEEWSIHGRTHRLDGPACIEYFSTGQISAEIWYIDNKRHRLDGPSIIFYGYDGEVEVEEYYLYGVRYYSKGEHEAELLKLVRRY